VRDRREIVSDEDDVSSEFEKLLQEESNKKIKKAMQLFIRVDDAYKRVFIHGSGFTGELTAKNLRNHFDTMDLMDSLDDAIWNFEDELENS